ncbi:MAG: hypothetical protein RML94_06205 [Bacteroidia bacterium]|nr:hypothetical protein [Bacteroidia bacterium]
MGVSLWAFRLRSYPQGRRATGYAITSVLRCATHWANAHPPHASRRERSTYTIPIYSNFYLVST